MSNKDLLKQAIAEAKTIREAAIANAKEALEETLTPHLKEMLAQKLQEMDNEDDMDESINNAEELDYSENPNTHGNLEEAEEAEEEEAEEEETPEGEEEKEEGEEEEELEIEDMSVEDLKDLIRDIVAQEVGHDESEEELSGEEGPEGQEDMVSMDSEEEIDINELLAELSEMDDNEKEVKEGLGSAIKGAAKKVGSAINRGLEKAADAGTPIARKIAEPGATNVKNVSEQDLEENVDIIYELIQMFPFLTNSTAQMLLGAFGAVGLTGLSAIASKVQDMALAGKFGEKGKAFAEKLQAAGGAAAKSTQVSEESEELNEALKAVKILRNQLQEVNLLNAKLLYVNKVFKSNNLSEGQKVNVIAAFDKAETVKEVKLVFETVSKNVVAKPAAIKEHRSFASKATGNAQTTAPKEILSEVSDQVARWQKLAGIIK